jgi:hypothetical protein
MPTVGNMAQTRVNTDDGPVFSTTTFLKPTSLIVVLEGFLRNLLPNLGARFSPFGPPGSGR